MARPLSASDTPTTTSCAQTTFFSAVHSHRILRMPGGGAEIRDRGRESSNRAENDAQQTKANSVNDARDCGEKEIEMKLMEWAWNHGVSQDLPIRIAYCALSACRGMVAARAIATGETILSIPGNLLMSADTALLCPKVLRMIEAARSAGEHLCERQILALHLLVERRKGASSKWSPFLASIPTAYNTLEYWQEEDVPLLQHPPLLKMARKRRTSVRAEFSQLLRLRPHGSGSMLQLRESGDGVDKSGEARDVIEALNEVLKWEEYRWAAATVSTRSCHYVPYSPLAHELRGEKVSLNRALIEP
jgi:hypothetical protein